MIDDNRFNEFHEQNAVQHAQLMKEIEDSKKLIAQLNSNQQDILSFVNEIKGGRRYLVWLASLVGAVGAVILGIWELKK